MLSQLFYLRKGIELIFVLIAKSPIWNWKAKSTRTIEPAQILRAIQNWSIRPEVTAKETTRAISLQSNDVNHEACVMNVIVPVTHVI